MHRNVYVLLLALFVLFGVVSLYVEFNVLNSMVFCAVFYVLSHNSLPSMPPKSPHDLDKQITPAISYAPPKNTMLCYTAKHRFTHIVDSPLIGFVTSKNRPQNYLNTSQNPPQPPAHLPNNSPQTLPKSAKKKTRNIHNIVFCSREL